MNDHQTIVNLIEQQASIHPNKNSIVFEQESISYARLSYESSLFSDILKQEYLVLPGDLVILSVNEKSIESIIAIIAILKSGATYVPISPSQPNLFFNKIMEDSKFKCILTSEPGRYKNSFNIANLREVISYYDINKNFIDSILPRNDTAYVMFSSGTTGEPKGISINSSGLVSAYNSWEEIYQLSPQDNHLQMADIAFDVFMGDLVRALCSGGTLFLYPKKFLLHPKKLFEYIKDNKISVAEFVPVVLNRLSEYLKHSNKIVSEIRVLICGSDLWRMSDCKKTKSVFNQKTIIYNSYGTTEGTIDSCYFNVTNKSLGEYCDSNTVPIGVPFPHVSIKIMSNPYEATLPGNIGEIYIGGPGVSKNYYLGNKLLTQSRFIDLDGNIFYRTGDLGKLSKNNDIIFLGRNDFQIKINGKRIDTYNIESILTTHKNITHAIVILAERGNGSCLEAYLVTKSKLHLFDIREFLSKKLPRYCIPKRFYSIPKIPLTYNGKIDRRYGPLNLISHEIRYIQKEKLI